MTHPNTEVLTPRHRLESWKEIAAYLNRSERTVRRWEEKEGLPVHRQQHDKRGSVYGFTNELDAWRESRRQLMETEPPDASTAASVSRRRWPWAAVGTALMLAAAAGGFWLFTRQPPATTASTPNPEAVRLVELANFAGNAGRVQIQTGMRYYQDALRLDPMYARAWAGLAVAHLVSVWFAEVPPREAVSRAKNEAEQALRLDPRSGQAWRVLAFASHYADWDHTTAEAQFRKAIDVDPQSGVASSWFGDFLVDMRRFDEARISYRQAQEKSPRWLEPIAFAGNIHLFTGNPDMAIVEYRRTLESEPNFGLANHYLGRAYLAKGQYESAIRQLRKSNELLGQIPFSMGDLGYGLAVAGRRADAEAMLSDLMGRRTQAYYPAFPIAQILLGLDRTEAALEWLERAADERHMGFYLPSVDTTYDRVRSHPRFKAVMKRANLPQ
jgi:Tfp pilus assembly protein PilF